MKKKKIILWLGWVDDVYQCDDKGRRYKKAVSRYAMVPVWFKHIPFIFRWDHMDEILYFNRKYFKYEA